MENNEKNTAYFTALTDGLQKYLPDNLQKYLSENAPSDSNKIVQKAKQLMGIEGQNFDLNQVHSIMPTVIPKNRSAQALPIVEVDENSGIFRTKTNEDSKTPADLLLKLNNSSVKIATDNKQQFDYTVYHHLYRYTARVGCDANVRETSLFDQNRLLAATTACLEQLDSQVHNFYLVKGDLSGIQGFIYANFSLEKPGDGRKSSKRLRGRSFLIAMLTNYIAEYIVEQLGLFQANIIFAGGGHFNLLLPATTDVDNKLKGLEEVINTMLFDEVGMTTSLVLAKTEIKFDTEKNPTPFADVSEYYAELATEIRKEKYKRNLDQLHKFMPQIIDSERLVKLNNIGMQLGETIPRAEVLAQIVMKENVNMDEVVYKNKEEEIRKGVVFHLKKARTIFVAFKNDTGADLKTFIEYNKDKIASVKIIQLNDTDLTKSMTNIPKIGNIPIGYGFTFVGKYAPTFDEKEEGEADNYNRENNLKGKDKYKERDVKPFDELAKMCCNPKEKIEFHQLAVVRLDIDNLGSIFARGLGQVSTFQRLATLSREFNQFFSGYFNVLAKEYEIYITYSGGDDAFVVGSWYNVLHFMVALKEKFDEFVCGNDCITFSAGIFMCHPHYPVGRFAKDAEAYEGKAKAYPHKVGVQATKNAVHIFDHTLSWKSFDSKMSFALKLLKYTNKEGTKDPEKLARSLVHRLLRILRSSLKNDGSVIVDAHRIHANVARLHYLFARHGFDDERIKEATEGIAKDVVKVILDNFDDQNAADYLIPFNYVIMKTRKMN